MASLLSGRSSYRIEPKKGSLDLTTTTSDLEKRVFARIDELEDELLKIALYLGNISSSQVDEAGNKVVVRDIRQHERIGAQYVQSWLDQNGFETKRQGAPDRFNVLGIYRGTGKGRSILFNSHLDCGSTDSMEWKLKDPEERHRNSTWRDGDSLVGQGVANCKGPMACWMVATKAIKDEDIQLPGDVLLSAVVGETGGAPVDDFESPKWDSHELGARYVASHGAIADYVLCAEATAFGLVLAMTGFAYFKVTILAGPNTYTPFLRRPEPSRERSVSAVVRMARFIDKFEDYADEYARTNAYSFDGGTMVPNAIIGAIQGGIPAKPTTTPELCSVYLDFRIAPNKNPLDIQRDLEGILADIGTEGKVEMFKFLRGQEGSRNKGFDTFRKAITDAHVKMFNEPPKEVADQFLSMWRDLNPYNEIGIPSISYGFPTGYTQPGATEVMASAEDTKVKIADMVTAAKLYASITLDICNRPISEPL